MKRILTCLASLLLVQVVVAQSFYASAERLTTTDGTSILMDEILSSTEGTILVFWEINDPQCNANLQNLHQAWTENIQQYGVHLVSVCIDKSGNWMRIGPYVDGKGWMFDTYIDTNGDLKRAMNITTTPYTILLDGNLNVKCRYPGYCRGDEKEICDKIIHCMEQNGTLAGL